MQGIHDGVLPFSARIESSLLTFIRGDRMAVWAVRKRVTAWCVISRRSFVLRASRATHASCPSVAHHLERYLRLSGLHRTCWSACLYGLTNARGQSLGRVYAKYGILQLYLNIHTVERRKYARPVSIENTATLKDVHDTLMKTARMLTKYFTG